METDMPCTLYHERIGCADLDKESDGKNIGAKSPKCHGTIFAVFCLVGVPFDTTPQRECVPPGSKQLSVVAGITKFLVNSYAILVAKTHTSSHNRALRSRQRTRPFAKGQSVQAGRDSATVSNGSCPAAQLVTCQGIMSVILNFLAA